ncbi:AbrB/MazE/SpoVT family DNA-binding domain-containing protein [Patescibacteria group bacterium]|nr:AbrB/MazE/SpoVT family DNA-binding domain-containing protein [Patescibacteria group bacterium]
MATITIPRDLMKKGDLVIIPRKEYEEFLNLKKIISKDQSWFWTKEWQEKENEADESFRKGKYKEFKNVKDLIKDLHG